MEEKSITCHNYVVDRRPAYHQIHELGNVSSTKQADCFKAHGNPHANCSRNRTSPEYSRLMSLMPYFIIAMRSRPMPKAKPEILSGS